MRAFNREPSTVIRAAADVYALAVFVQVVAWFAIFLLSLVADSSISGPVYRVAEQFYAPVMRLFFYFMPLEWQYTGNYMLGFLCVGFSILLYAIPFSVLVGMVQWKRSCDPCTPS